MWALWHDIALMNKLSRVIWRVAAVLLLLAGVFWVLQRPYFAIHQFRFVGDVQQFDQGRLHDMMEKHLSDGLSGGFFSMNLKEVEASLKDISWVKSTSVRRVWPHEIEINVEAYKPVALWHAGGYLSAEGQVFNADLNDKQKPVLLVAGPTEASKLVADNIPIFSQWFTAMGWTLQKLELSDRYSWLAVADNGLQVEFGRADTPSVLQERANRLQQSASFVKDNLAAGEAGAYIDLRYPNGFAMRSHSLHRVSNGVKVNNGAAVAEAEHAVKPVKAATPVPKHQATPKPEPKKQTKHVAETNHKPVVAQQTAKATTKSTDKKTGEHR